MSTLQTLKNRLKTAENILHITEAMELVASIQYQKLMKKIDHFRYYTSKLNEMMERLKGVAGHGQHPLFNKGNSPIVQIIVIAGDKGLCGSYNSKVLHEAEVLIKMFDSDNIELILLGKKAVDYFKRKQWKVVYTDSHFAHVLSRPVIQALADRCIDSLVNHQMGELWVVYTHFRGALKIKALEYNFLPLVNPEDGLPKESIDFIFDPNAQEIYNTIIEHFFCTKLESLILDSYASELCSRMIAMKTSTKNAREMIVELTLAKNKLRQLNITREILEISAGAESIK